MPNFWSKISESLHHKASKLSAVSNDIPNVNEMSEEEMIKSFELLIDDMNLTDEKKNALRQQPIVQKKQILEMNYRRKANIKTSNAMDYVNSLKNLDLKPLRRISLLRSVRVHLRSETLQWIKSFGKDGLIVLLGNLKLLLKYLNVATNTEHVDALHEAILCIGCFINSTYGMQEAFKVEDLMLYLTRCISIKNPSLLVDLLQILAAICIYPGGHEKVLEGFTLLRKQKKLPHRFVDVVEGMRESYPYNVQEMCLQLMNAIVSTPEDIELRQHLRCEFMRSGLAEIYNSLSKYNADNVNSQFKIFKNQFNDDIDELKNRFHQFTDNFNNLDDCWALLRGMVVNGPSESYLISILQHLLFVRDDHYTRLGYFGLVESLIGQAIIQKGGVDPDPDYKLLNFDVCQITSNFDSQMKKKDKSIETIKEEFENKLSNALSAKMEAESKNLLLMTKLNELSNGNANLSFHSNSSKNIKVDIKSSSEPTNSVPKPPPPLIPKIQPPRTGGIVPPPPLLLNKLHPPLNIGKNPPPFNGMVPPPPMGLKTVAVKVEPKELPFGMRKKRILETETNTKRLNWNKIKPEIFNENSFWVKSNEDRFYDSLFKKSVENFFALKHNHIEKISGDNCMDLLKRKVKELRVIDSNTSQGISILIANLKMSPDELKNEFLAVNINKIQSATLEQLLKALPDDSTLSRLDELTNEYDNLADCEKYLVKLSQIKGLRTRAELMLFMLHYNETLQDNMSSIASVTEACNQIITSHNFATVIELILLIGNILNINTRNSETYGFDILILPRLIDTKSADGSLSFLHFLLETIEKKSPKSLTFHRDFTSLKKAASVCPDIIRNSLAYYEKNIIRLEKLIPNYENQGEHDRFVPVFQEFFDRIYPQQTLLVTMNTKMEESSLSLIKYFSLSPKTVATSQIFEAISKFCQQIMDAHEDILNKREIENKKRTLAKDSYKVNKKFNKYEEGIMDNLVEALKSGTAFKHKRKIVKNDKNPDLNKLFS